MFALQRSRGSMMLSPPCDFFFFLILSPLITNILKFSVLCGTVGSSDAHKIGAKASTASQEKDLLLFAEIRCCHPKSQSNSDSAKTSCFFFSSPRRANSPSRSIPYGKLVSQNLSDKHKSLSWTSSMSSWLCEAVRRLPEPISTNKNHFGRLTVNRWWLVAVVSRPCWYLKLSQVGICSGRVAPI